MFLTKSGEFTEVFNGRSAVRGMRFFGRFVVAKINFTLVYAYFCAPPIVNFSNSFESRSVVGTKFGIGYILAFPRQSKIGPAIVVLYRIFVVNIFFRPFLFFVKVCKAASQISFFINRYVNVSVGIKTSRGCTSSMRVASSHSGAILPYKVACFRAIIKKGREKGVCEFGHSLYVPETGV